MMEKATFKVVGIYSKIVIVKHPLNIPDPLLKKISSDNIILRAAMQSFKEEKMQEGKEEIFSEDLNYIVTSEGYYFAANEESFGSDEEKTKKA